LLVLTSVLCAADQRIHSKYKRGIFTWIHGIEDTSRIDFKNAQYVGTKGDSLMLFDTVTGDTVSLYELVHSAGGASSQIYVSNAGDSVIVWSPLDSLSAAKNQYGTLRIDSTFSIYLIPDTQLEIQNYPGIVDTMMTWIADVHVDSNVIFVIGLGDIVQSALKESEWVLADSFYNKLSSAWVPYYAAEGNHDISGYYFDTYFGPERYKDMPWYGGVYKPDSTRYTYSFTEFGEEKFIIVALRCSGYSHLSMKHFLWTDSLFKAYPEHG